MTGYTYCEVIKERLARLNWTLRNLRRPIHMVGTIHKQTVKMQRRGLIPQIILRVHQNRITHSRFDPGNRPLSIDTNRRPLKGAIRIRSDPFNSEIIRNRSSQSRGHQKRSQSKVHVVDEQKSERAWGRDLINQIIRRREC